MRQAVLSIDESGIEEFGMGEFMSVIRDAELLDTELLSCEGTKGVTRIRVKNEIDPSSLDELESVEWWEEVVDSGAEHVYLIGFDTPEQPDAVDVCFNGMLPVENIDVDENGYTFAVTGSHEEISEFVSGYEDAGMNVSLKELRGYRDQKDGRSLSSLTARQREVIETAYEIGYYDVPRTASTLDVAEELGVDDSTVSEHLQRAEHNLLSEILPA